MFRTAKTVVPSVFIVAIWTAAMLAGCETEGDGRASGSGAHGEGGGAGYGGQLGGGAAGGATGGSGATGGGGATGGAGATGGSGGGGGVVDECPDGVICVTEFPFTHSSTTTGAAADQFDSYGCAPSVDESGPEVIYRVDIPEDGFLALELPEGQQDPDADVDVHLLQDLDPASCLNRGHLRTGALLAAGRYWVTADTWVAQGGEELDGAYTLTFGLTTVAGLAAMGMDGQVASDALWAFDTAWSAGEATHFGYGITDFSLPSDMKRLWALSLASGALVHHAYVAHGEMSADPNDTKWAVDFSNESGSHQSSLGVMLGGETYTGTYGYSMRLHGLEPGYNDNVFSRAIVVHPWDGSTQGYVDYWGESAPTWGCAGLDPAICSSVVDLLAAGGLLIFHYPDGDWSASSAYLP